MGVLSRAAGSRPTRVFFAADIHGSQLTYRKFVRAASFYEVDALVFGGDLMGKALVPIVRENATYLARFQGRDHELDEDGLAPFRASVDVAGFYSSVVERDRYDELRGDPLALKAEFRDRASERLRSWIDLAEDELAGTAVRLYLTGGNDDEPSVLAELEDLNTDHVVACEGAVVEVDDRHTMITVGLSTPTPWDTPREASEEEIAMAIEREVAKVPDPSRCVFNFHCPPKDTSIDTCLALETSTGLGPGELPKPLRKGGRFVYTGGGSTAVREAVARYQPTVALHGHIHESMGRFRIGRTQCFNPGSEYLQGVLQGWIVALRDGKLAGYQHTSG
jgi:Icc-related predicted phosphoesterase